MDDQDAWKHLHGIPWVLDAAHIRPVGRHTADPYENTKYSGFRLAREVQMERRKPMRGSSVRAVRQEAGKVSTREGASRLLSQTVGFRLAFNLIEEQAERRDDKKED